MKPTLLKPPLTGRSFLALILVSGVVLALSLGLNACNDGQTTIPTATPTMLPTTTPTLLPTLTLTPTSLAPLDGRGGGVIAYASWERSEWQIYAVNADGSGERQITIGTRGGYEPNWSPDGTQIVFQYDGLWIADLISGEISRLPLSVEGNNLENEYLVKPSWSPDGEWIAFLNESGFQGDLYFIRPDGSDLTRLTDSNDISRDGNLVWSPDGGQLAYSANRDGNIEIYILDVEKALQGGAASQQLTDGPGFARNLVTSWSPDGSKIAFSSDRDGNTEIYIMSVDGSNAVRLTNNRNSDTEPAWSPDGKQIVFSSNRDGDIEIYMLDVEEAIQSTGDSNVQRLTDHPGDEAGPVWMPVIAGTTNPVFSQLPDLITPQAKYMIFLHGQLVEEQGVQNPTDPRFGLYDYTGILHAMAVNGNQVISEVRTRNTDPLEYAGHVVGQVNALINAGVQPENISVVGFSKGGAITILVS